MTHPNETLLREAYAAFAKGDIPGFVALCTPDISFHVPGKGLLGGSHSLEQFLAALGPAMGAVGGSFREEVTHVVASDGEGFVMAAQRATSDAIEHRWNAVHWWRISGGKLAEFREFIDDAGAFDAAWHR